MFIDMIYDRLAAGTGLENKQQTELCAFKGNQNHARKKVNKWFVCCKNCAFGTFGIVVLLLLLLELIAFQRLWFFLFFD